MRARRRRDTKNNTNAVLIEVGRRLRAHREHLGLSLTQAEVRIGIDSVRIGSYERADRGMSLTMFWELAEAYGLDPVSLLPSTQGDRLVTDDQVVSMLRDLADRLEAKDADR